MAPETRIGLVVGLAFIVCFAVILANKGQRDRNMLSWLPDGDRKANVHPTGRPLTVPSRQPWTNRETHEVRSLPNHSVGPPAMTGGERGRSTPVPTSGATVLTAGATSREAEVPAPEVLAEVSLTAAGEAGEPPWAQEDSDAMAPIAQSPVADRASTSQSRDAVERSAAAPAVTERRDTASMALVRHTVVKGDTLSRTARTYYGRRSTRIVTAIYEANRSALSGPDKLPLGTVLILPAVDGIVPRSSPSGLADSPAATPARRASPFAPPPEKLFRWYQIRKSDRYASIARRQLGDESRWREIFELNQEKFPDADRIREGVRIKLPLTRIATAGGT